jgi:hypothetical protein
VYKRNTDSTGPALSRKAALALLAKRPEFLRRSDFTLFQLYLCTDYSLT